MVNGQNRKSKHWGYFGIGVWHPKFYQNTGTLFRSAVCFGADFVFTVGRRYDRQSSDTVHVVNCIPTYHYLTVDQLIANLPQGCRLIGVELDNRAVSLQKYTHPMTGCYMLGAEDHGLSSEVLDKCHELVYVPGASSCLNVASAGTVVMYDRFNKRGIR